MELFKRGILIRNEKKLKRRGIKKEKAKEGGSKNERAKAINEMMKENTTP